MFFASAMLGEFILIVLFTFVSYVGVSIIIKAFKISDINLKY